MSRHPKWEARLCDLVAAKMTAPYEWGRHDCMTWSADVAKAVTGRDHARKHRGRYRSFASAYSYLKNELGHDSTEALLDSLFDEKPVGFAHRGDLVMADDGIPALCLGAFALSIGEGQAGLVLVPRSAWVKAWRVG